MSKPSFQLSVTATLQSVLPARAKLVKYGGILCISIDGKFYSPEITWMEWEKNGSHGSGNAIAPDCLDYPDTTDYDMEVKAFDGKSTEVATGQFGNSMTKV